MNMNLKSFSQWINLISIKKFAVKYVQSKLSMTKTQCVLFSIFFSLDSQQRLIYLQQRLIICEISQSRQIALFRYYSIWQIGASVWYSAHSNYRVNLISRHSIVSLGRPFCYVTLLYYIPFSNLITGLLYSGRKLVTRYKANHPAYAMTPVWPLIRTPSGFSRDDSGWSLTPRCPHRDSVWLPASLLARRSESCMWIMRVIDRTGCQPK